MNDQPRVAVGDLPRILRTTSLLEARLDGVREGRAAREARLAKLKPTARTISIRLPGTMLEDLKVLANKRDVPYQSLLKIYVAERIEEELRLSRIGGAA